LAAINKSHAAGDHFPLYLLATREGADFNLALIPSTFSVRPNRPWLQGCPFRGISTTQARNG
jgi:hypothetical protein